MKSFSKKILLTFFTLLLILTSLLPTKIFAADEAVTIDIVEVTDFHGTLLSTTDQPVGAVLADRLKKVKAANPNTLILGGGDLYQGSAISNMLQGIPVQEMFSDIGMDVSTIGNHEFDWTLDVINNITMKDAKYDNVCANIRYKSNNELVYPAYKIIEKGGVRIAVIGGILNNVSPIISAAMTKDIYFTDLGTEVYNVAKDIKDNNKADIIIGLLHTDSDLKQVAAKCEGYVDLLFGGHSHTTATTINSGIPTYNGNSNGKGYIHVQVTVKNDGTLILPTPKSSDYVALNNTAGYTAANPITDPETMELVRKAAKAVEPIAGEVIGNTSKELTRSNYLQNWSTDAMRRQLEKSGYPADVAFTNTGGLRVDIPAGDITVGTMWQFMPFDNTIYMLEMNKAGLKTILEQSAVTYLPMSGIKYSYDTKKPVGSRVYEITRADGTPISDTEILNVAVPDFIATGGDGFTSFLPLGGDNTENDTHILLRDTFIDDIKDHKSVDFSTISDNILRRTSGTAPVIADADKLQLAAAISEAKKLVKEDFATQDWDEFAAVVAEAEAIYTSTNATQAVVDGAVLKLNTAVNTLLKKPLIKVDLSTDTHIIRKGAYFKVQASFKDVVNGNAAVIRFTYDTDLFEYAGEVLPENVTLLVSERVENGVNLTLMISNYNTKDLLSLLLRAKETAILANADKMITAEVDVVVKDAEGNKSIISTNSNLSITTGKDVEGDVNGNGSVDLIDLSDIIDAFGKDASDPQWNTIYKFMDFNNNKVIDIQDIIHVASKLQEKKAAA